MCTSRGRLGIIRPSTRLRIQAPEIPREDLIPLPQATVLCRQPCYHDEANPDKETSSDKRISPQIEAHPQRARLAEILRQRLAPLAICCQNDQAGYYHLLVNIKPATALVDHFDIVTVFEQLFHVLPAFEEQFRPLQDRDLQRGC